MNELKLLRNLIDHIDFPENVIKINGEIKGKGFFPGANGITDESTEISNKKYMIIGQDQDNEKGFEYSVEKGSEEHTSTWRNLKELLEEVNISEYDCFFTNFLLGLRKNSMRNVGKSPAISNSKFFFFDFFLYAHESIA